ncbi:MAG: hypothetical protein HYT35_00930 [Candidatus Staskawiczbacteria bacterium]|nr:hypothetical protein [Candidatus Staskawiczbacteria bacterium]
MNEERPDNQENYRTEYKEIAAIHRLCISLRFITAAFAATLQSALLTFYNQALQQFPLRGQTIIIPFIGIITMFAVFFIERRNITLFRTMIKRGKELEFNLALTNGQFGMLSELTQQRGWKKFFTHTWGIGLIYVMIQFLWIVLLTFSFTNR